MTAIQSFSKQLSKDLAKSKKTLEENQVVLGDLTQEFSILPDPQFFTDRIHADAEDHSVKIRELVVEKILESKNGHLDLDLKLCHGKDSEDYETLKVPPMWHEYVKESLTKWAEMAGYKITFDITDEQWITDIQIQPADFKEIKKKKVRRLHLPYWGMKGFPIALALGNVGWLTYGIIQLSTVGTAASPLHVVIPLLAGSFLSIGCFAWLYDAADTYKANHQRYWG